MLLTPISTLRFSKWLLKDKENRTLLLSSAVAIIITFGFLKVLYPYPNFMPPDSNSYLEAANTNQYINLWPIGYSKFVRLISSFSNSHFLLVTIQYLMLQVALLYFLFSFRYLFSPAKWSFRVLLILSAINPLIIHISNFISSDALFTALSLVWLAQIFWIIYQPTKKILYTHSVIILLAFTVRFVALYYPLISIVAILFSNTSVRAKLLSIGLTVLLLASFIAQTAHEYKLKTKTVQYSAFGGWQLASNALYGYAHSQLIPVEKVPPAFKPLHNIVNKHMKDISVYPPFLRPDRDVAVYYLWDFNSPLRVYMSKKYPKVSNDEFFYKWATFAPLYESYGKYLIAHRPKEFFVYYLWPNFLNYYSPPTKFMGRYNLEHTTVDPIVVKWFGWRNNKLPAMLSDRKIETMEVYPILFSIINIVFVFGFISFLILGGLKECNKVYRLLLFTVIIVWTINMVFGVFAAPIELRYQIFPFVFTLSFTWLLSSYLISKAREKQEPDVQQVFVKTAI
jgi:hypothetical protein